MSNSQPRQGSFLGTGWAFPPTFDRHRGEVAMTTAEADIRQSLEIILGTQPGERSLHPHFGCELSQFLFESIEQGVLTSIQGVVFDALVYHESRIKVNRISVSPSPTEMGLLLIEVDYTVRQTNSRTNLVYPFYLTEATDVERP